MARAASAGWTDAPATPELQQARGQLNMQPPGLVIYT
jgi:hypothetical protein